MGNVVNFDSRARFRPAGRSASPAGAATVLIFEGVRIERLEERLAARRDCAAARPSEQTEH